MSALLSVKGLEKTFGKVVAARDINVDVPQGQTVGIIGSNGAGKTTFVNMITGHLPPSGGTISFEGNEITGLPSRKIMRLGIARSFQVAQVFPTFTVFENLCAAVAIARAGSSVMGAAIKRFVSAGTTADAEAALTHFQLTKFREAKASTLPQGMRKLLDIAMATAGNPRLLLLDEPTSGISLEEKFGLMDVIMAALKARGTTILFVEHDMDIVQRFADRVLAFYDGTVIADGPPETALGDERVREFITGTLIRAKDGTLRQGGGHAAVVGGAAQAGGAHA
jgi:branched-chain amino acid transport system ATP-binding protein